MLHTVIALDVDAASREIGDQRVGDGLAPATGMGQPWVWDSEPSSIAVAPSARDGITILARAATPVSNALQNSESVT